MPRLRKQIQSLSLDVQKDAGFNQKMVTFLYALEVQDSVASGDEAELQDIQEAYDIPQEVAAEIVQVSKHTHTTHADTH